MSNKNRIKFMCVLLIPLILAACNASTHDQTKFTPPMPPTVPANLDAPQSTSSSDPYPMGADIPLSEDQTVLGFTYQTSSGNRYIAGKGNLPLQTPINIDLPGRPIWINGAPHGTGSMWTVFLENGKVINFLAANNGVQEVKIPPNSLPPGMPPSVKSISGNYSIITVPDQNQSTSTHPIYLPSSKLQVHVTQTGEIQFTDLAGENMSRLSVNALPDARILFDERERLLLLSNPTDRYSHGVLGDNLEAGSITLIETQPMPRIETVITLPDNEVVEGISPIWEDVDLDGEREIITTISDLALGSGIVIFSESGSRLAEGPKMGRSFRWRHQIAYADVGPQDEFELVVVRTPHIGGVVEYYQYSDESLIITAEYSGITSHAIGSRNLDMAALGDFDGDGINELLLPDPDLSTLVAVQRTGSGAEQDWLLPVNGVISTNISGVTLKTGKIAIAIGREDGVLNLWLP